MFALHSIFLIFHTMYSLCMLSKEIVASICASIFFYISPKETVASVLFSLLVICKEPIASVDISIITCHICIFLTEISLKIMTFFLNLFLRYKINLLLELQQTYILLRYSVKSNTRKD